MSRFLLDESTLSRISQNLPNLRKLRMTVTGLVPDFISINFDPESTAPIAAVCLDDSTLTLSEARYALSECFAHRIWYGEKTEPPNEILAVFLGRFYADDAALRLYSAGEHLANAIVFMLEIGEPRLKQYKKHKISQQSAVGNFLAREEPHHPITKAVLQLNQSKEWQDTIDYRHKWVHEQPPTVNGLGTVYRREKRWQISEPSEGGQTFMLGIGDGDKPEYSSVDDLIRFIQPALFLFTDTLTAIVQFYIGLLEKRGITIDERGQLQAK
jgi:hypothetical protein